MAIWFANPCIATGVTITVDDTSHPVSINNVVFTNSPYGCVRIYSSSPSSAATYNVTSVVYSGGCLECIEINDYSQLPPISAGTEYTMCVQDCSGNTISVSVPHPTWTNNQGRSVILLDAVQLGGSNGLYN